MSSGEIFLHAVLRRWEGLRDLTDLGWFRLEEVIDRACREAGSTPMLIRRSGEDVETFLSLDWNYTVSQVLLSIMAATRRAYDDRARTAFPACRWRQGEAEVRSLSADDPALIAARADAASVAAARAKAFRTDPRVPILVVDDESHLRRAIKDWLAPAGYRAITAAGLEEARALLGTSDDLPRCIVLDVILGRELGLDWLPELAADPRLAGIPVLFLCTVTPEDAYGHINARGREMGLRWLPKPFRTDARLREVASMLRADPPHV